VIKIKCPICENYYIAGEVRFEKLRITHKNPWIRDEYLKVCPKCYKEKLGVMEVK
jgi:uncharacterized protein (DUF2225 family)